MKKLLPLVLSFSLMSVIAFAQPVQPQQPTEYNLKVKSADLDKIGKGLGKLPFEEVAELLQSLRQQIVEQQQPKKPVENKSNNGDTSEKKKGD